MLNGCDPGGNEWLKASLPLTGCTNPSVTVCVTLSRFVQRTVSPRLIVTFCPVKVRFWIVTSMMFALAALAPERQAKADSAVLVRIGGSRMGGSEESACRSMTQPYSTPP